jgi:hypothetical protein
MKNQSVYLVAFYSMRPKNRVRTQVKGWMEDANNIQYDEQVAVTTKLKKSDRDYAKIILDMGTKQVVRNRWNSNNSFDELFGYFAKGYPKYTYEIMGRLDPEYMTQFMTPIRSDITAEELASEITERNQLGINLAASVSEETVIVDTPAS